MSMTEVRNTAELISNGKLEIGDGYRAKNSELSIDGAPFVRASNVNGGFVLEDADRIPYENLPKVGRKVSQTGDSVYTTKGTVGRAAYVTDALPQLVYSPQLSYWRSLDHEYLHPRFLFYWLHGREFRAQVGAVKGQTDMADYVSLSDQRRMTITVPPINEQQAIACILGALDDKIDLNRRMNETLESMARALYKSWFVDFDPVVAKAAGKPPFAMDDATAALFPDRFVDSELGPIPDGWSVRPLDEIGRFVNGKNFTKNASGTGRMVMRIAELNRGISSSTVYNDVDANTENIANPGDLLFAWSGSLDAYRWHREAALINQHIFKVIPGDVPTWFMHQAIEDSIDFFRTIAEGKATTMGHIKRSHLSEAFAVVPQSNLMSAANDRIQPLYDLWLWNHQESQTLAELRDLLLPKLLSGDIRVTDAEKVVEEAV